MTQRILTYAESGVSIDRATDAKARIKKLAQQTFNKNVLSEIGGFGGLFRLDVKKLKDPVLVSSVDGVGTKLKVAFLTGQHRTVGADLVNHCVNDILVQGAFPLFFLDYMAMGRMDVAVVEQLLEGLASGCRAAGCALIGGETAEMPDFYQAGEYDLAGCIVGLVEKKQIINGRAIKPGDVLLGLPSAGLHTNGYSLARKILFDRMGVTVSQYVEELQGTVGDTLLAPHRSYLPALKDLATTGKIKGLAHITGGGLTANLPRILPPGCQARIHLGSWPVLPIFRFLQRSGHVPDDDMYRTFNMGIGMVLVVAKRNVAFVEQALKTKGELCYSIGEIVAGLAEVGYQP
ncbi:MAG: phosphoribosylformylglycinamidine cyclo-ligase [Acidobacteria bacterium]|nr:phosphoribosylformylglycinamidine cyclo-ligase [Acidobacteriota bacterium]MBI3655155.1 phosphoribosylformylglycinamidine cyclo-ligase [Acidobacteriota bacterium]